MNKLILFEPAMCCSTGACGCSADPELQRVAAVIEKLKQAGIEVARYSLSADPAAFMQNEAVSDALYRQGEAALPIAVMDDKIVKSGSYPTTDEFAKLLGVSPESIRPAIRVKVKKCGCGADEKCC